MSQVSVVIPALNEAESIGYVVRSMPWEKIAECIVVDNGSTDGTGGIAAAAGARVIESARGYGAACLAGSQAAMPGTEILVYMDGDGSDVIEEFSKLVEPIEAGAADFVIGSRIRGERESGSMLASQVFAGRMVGALLRLIYPKRARYTDMGQFRAIRRSSLEAMKMSELTYGWNIEMQMKALQMGLRVREVPVSYRRRFGGTSKVSGNLSASARAGIRILRVVLRIGLKGGRKRS